MHINVKNVDKKVLKIISVWIVRLDVNSLVFTYGRSYVPITIFKN